jgi:ATP-dependent protease ClpP protease subunit
MSDQKEGRSNLVLDTFMSRRTVVLTGEINSQTIGETGQKLITLQARSSIDPINLVIDCLGGSINEALYLCDLISTVMTAPVHGIALGQCGSAATFIMLHCEERTGTPYSRFLIHSGTWSKISIPIGQATSENLKQILQEVNATEQMVLDLYMNRLTPPHWVEETTPEEKEQFVLNLIKRGDQDFDDRMSAKDAVKAGLITSITHGKLNIFKD